MQVDVPFAWGHNGPKWKINDKNEHEISIIQGNEWSDTNSIYSIDMFHSNTFQQLRFRLKISNKRDCMQIGVINNCCHKNRDFDTEKIPYNKQGKIKKKYVLGTLVL